MLNNFFKPLFRSTQKSKFFSFLNIFGLATGLLAAILILLYLRNELSYDKYNLFHKRIYRLESHFTIDNKDDKFAITQVPLGPAMKDEYPDIEEYVRFREMGRVTFIYKDREYQAEDIFFADSSVFRVFTYSFVNGTSEKALNKPNTVVLSNTLARKIFGDQDPVGESLKTIDGDVLEVTGVTEDLPENTHLKTSGLVSMSTLAKQVGDDRFNDRSASSFWNVNVFTYVLLHPNSNIQNIVDNFPVFYDKYMKELGDQLKGHFYLMATPLAAIHLSDAGLQWDKPTGSMDYIYIFSVVALFILVIAAINYMNMATARSARRSREVGLKKVVGAQKSQLILQFLSESVLMVFVALIIALLLLPLFLPLFNELAGRNLSITSLFTPGIILTVLIATLVIGIISGIYPAFYLSSFQPAIVLKGKADHSGGSGLLRKLLVVLQIAISVGMIISTLIVSSQLFFMRNTNPGFDKNNMIVMIARDSTLRKSFISFRDELLKNPVIETAASSSGSPGYEMNKVVMRIEGDSGQMVERAINFYFIDYDYIGLMKMKLVAGRNYDRKKGTDPGEAFIINEAAARKFGWYDNNRENGYETALGKKFQFGINIQGPPARDGRIIGVMRDFHYASMHNEIEPVVLLLRENENIRNNYIFSMRIKPTAKEEAISFIDNQRKAFGDKYPFEYKFLDEKLSEYYKPEERITKIMKYFTLLTILIAALGLLGLSAFMTQQRTKEIGIRKVLGATTHNINILFAKEFLRWILIANIIAWPLSWYIMKRWLQHFVYPVDLSGWLFVEAGVISLIVALLTISFYVIKASNTNPAKVVKYE